MHRGGKVCGGSCRTERPSVLCDDRLNASLQYAHIRYSTYIGALIYFYTYTVLYIQQWSLIVVRYSPIQQRMNVASNSVRGRSGEKMFELNSST